MNHISAYKPLIAQLDGLLFIVTEPNSIKENRTYRIEIYTPDINQRLVLQLLDYNPDAKQENVTFFDAGRASINEHTPNWQLPKDLTYFPIVSSSQSITVQLKISGQRSERLTLAVLSRPLSKISGILFGMLSFSC